MMERVVVRSLWLIFGIIMLIEGNKYGQNAGPYDVILEKFERCEDEGTRQLICPTKILRKGKGAYQYDDPIILGIPVDENYATQLLIHSWGNGGWKVLSNITIKGCKTTVKMFPGIMDIFSKGMGLGSTICPIPKGNYTHTMWEASLRFSSEAYFPIVFYNKYKTILTFLYNNEKVGCTTIYAETVPKL